MTESKMFIELQQSGIERVKTHTNNLDFIPVIIVPEKDPKSECIKVFFKDKHPKTFKSIMDEILLGNFTRTKDNTLRLTEYHLTGAIVEIYEAELDGTHFTLIK